MVQIELEKMGKLKSIHELIFSRDDKQLVSMNYQEKDLSLDIELISKKEKIYSLSYEQVDHSTNIIDLHKKPLQHPCNSLYRLISNHSSPIIHNYNNSQKEDDNYFTLNFNIDKNDIRIMFHKDKSVIEIPDQYCITYCNNLDGSINTDSIIEYLEFFNNGILISEGNTKNILSNKINAEFELFVKKNNKFNHPILNSLPTYIKYKNDQYLISYDDNGIISKCINKSNTKQLLSRYEIVDNIFSSIHPLLYDAFKYSNIDEPLKYWALDSIDLNDSFTIFRRFIYMIDENNLNNLIDLLNSDINYPIIKIDF